MNQNELDETLGKIEEIFSRKRTHEIMLQTVMANGPDDMEGYYKTNIANARKELEPYQKKITPLLGRITDADQFKVFHAKYYEGLTIDGITEKFYLAKSTVYTRLRKAKKKLLS